MVWYLVEHRGNFIVAFALL